MAEKVSTDEKLQESMDESKGRRKIIEDAMTYMSDGVRTALAEIQADAQKLLSDLTDFEVDTLDVKKNPDVDQLNALSDQVFHIISSISNMRLDITKFVTAMSKNPML